MPLGRVGAGPRLCVPLYLEKPANLLGAIALEYPGAAPEALGEAARGLVDAFILPHLRDLNLLSNGIAKVKACTTEAEALLLLQHGAARHIGANDSCVRFLSAGDSVCLIGANCQYSRHELGPRPEKDPEAGGTVEDNIDHFKAGARNAEIIGDYQNDVRQRGACQPYEEKGVTFYDGSSLHVAIRHDSKYGMTVLSHVEKEFYDPADAADMHLICRLVEMRLDELVAIDYRGYIESRLKADNKDRAFLPLEARFVLGEIDGRGPRQFLEDELKSGGRRLGAVAIVSRPRGPETNRDSCVVDAFPPGQSSPFLEDRYFFREAFRQAGDSHILRCVWVEEDGRSGQSIFTDQYYNLRQPEDTGRRPQGRLDPGWAVFLAPVDPDNGLWLWFEIDLGGPEGAGPRRTARAEMVDPRSTLWDDVGTVMSRLRHDMAAERATLAKVDADHRNLVTPISHMMGSTIYAVARGFAEVQAELEATDIWDRVEPLLKSRRLDKLLKKLGQLPKRIFRVRPVLQPKEIPAEECAAILFEEAVREADFEMVLDNQIGVERLKGLKVGVDEEMLRAAVCDVVRNAVEEMEALDRPRDERRMVVRSEVVGARHVRIYFDDNGPGFKDEIRAVATEIEQSTKGKGHGVGLWFVNRVLRMHGGSLNLERNPNEGGARVIFNLPTA